MKILHNIILTLVLPISGLYAADNFTTKSLLCSTKNFPVKGGFDFLESNNLVKYNILWDHVEKVEFVSISYHCYIEVNNEIAISSKSRINGCGEYTSFIDINNLTYKIPIEQKMLTAECDYFNGDLLQKIKSSINKKAIN